MQFKIKHTIQASDRGSMELYKPLFFIERTKIKGLDGKVRYKYEKVYKDTINCNDLLVDCIRNQDKEKGEFHNLVEFNKKKGREVTVVANENYENIEITKNKSLDKLQPRQLMFFTLYNAPEYKDLLINVKTYLDEVACWLISYGLYEDTYKQYGHIVKRKVRKVSEGYITKIYEDDNQVDEFEGSDIKDFERYVEHNYMCRKGNFVFNTQMDFVKVKQLARSVINSVAFKEAQNELVKESLADTETRIKDYYIKLDEIYKNTQDEKIRLECLKLGGKWLGMEHLNLNTEQNHIIQGIQVAVANGDLKDFDFDEDLFEKVEA